MKTKLVINIGFFFLFSSFCLHSQIKVDCTGNYGPSVGIGADPQPIFELTTGPWVKFYNGSNIGLIIDQSSYYALALYPTSNNYGNLGRSDRAFKEIWSYNYYDLNSDSTQKENIRTYKNALQVVKGLRGIKFDLKREIAINKCVTNSKDVEKLENDRKNRVGFVAQEMIKVFPEAVHYIDSTNIYGIDYTRVIPILVEAMKEQQTIIEDLQKEVNILKTHPNNLKSATVSVAEQSTVENSGIALYQNVPNPFSQSTTISYYLPEDIQRALICIYDMNGLQLKCIPLNQKGTSSINISSNALKAGMYMYSLIADGQLVDTKRMVLTE
jgi:hypothetical protein